MCIHYSVYTVHPGLKLTQYTFFELSL